MSTVIGIDLGTTNCSVTAIDDAGNTKVIKNRENEYITPSAVYFNPLPNSYIIGKRAKNKASSDIKNLVTLVKREMGKAKEEVRFSKMDRKYHPYIYWNKMFSPEEISSKILSQLKQDAQAELNCEIKEAVITCPAYFGQNEKEATRLAGELAGLDVLEVIPEPTAACLNYGTVTNKQNERIFVFDLGGGTFDITIVNVKDGDEGKDIKVECCNGDSKLGGADWDFYMLDYMLNEFKKKYHIDLVYEEGPEKDKAYGKLLLDVEILKKELSKPGVTSSVVTIDYGGVSFSKEISRDLYAEITEQLTDQCRIYCENLLNSKNLTWSDMDTILMVGSMSNCIFIQDALRKWSNKEVSFGVINPKTCVSEGAAIRAYSKICAREGKKTVVNTVVENMNYDSASEEDLALVESKVNNSKRVSTAIASATSVLPASVCLKLFKKDTEFAYKALKQFTTYPCSFEGKFPLKNDNMPEIELLILEGENDDPAYCMELGSVVLPLEGQHFRGDIIKVKISVDENGIIQVSGLDLKTNKSVKGEIRRKNSLSKEEIEEVKETAEFDFFLG